MRGNRFIDLEGQHFGRLTVIEESGRTVDSKVLWLCRCQCGTTLEVRGTYLRSGHTKSCGCLNREIASATMTSTMTKHGDCRTGVGPHDRTRLYLIWSQMRYRCLSPTAPAYNWYGGRGITVCEEWTDYNIFKDWALASGYRDDLCIDRIDNDGNYEPGNCQWITKAENSRKRWEDRRNLPEN